MKEKTKALLLYGRGDPFATLKPALENQGIKTIRAHSREEASRLLRASGSPPLVFTDTEFPDGSWRDVIHLAREAAQPVNVIVVSRLVDVRLYIEALEAGAFDFIAPPFEDSAIAHVVRCAAANAESMRQPTPTMASAPLVPFASA